MQGLYERVQAAAASIRRVWPHRPEFGVILGTGLEGLVGEIREDLRVPYDRVEGFLRTGVAGHANELHLGTVGGRRVLVMAGRFHLYEGHDPKEVTLPVRVMKALGCHTLLVSCAAGGMHPHLRLGDIALIEDHINLMGINPLVGENDERLGPRFPDMSAPYDRGLLELAERICLEERIRARPVVHVAVLGPNLETRAEYRFLRAIGADTVGMSTVPEVLVARHAGLRVFGAACITDLCFPDALEPVELEKILRVAAEADPKLTRLFARLIAEA